MAKTTPEKEEKKQIRQTENKPGHYESVFPKYPGYIQFPVPFMHHHMKLWWETTIQPANEARRFDFAKIDVEWQGARKLLIDYGEWNIAGVPLGDLKKDVNIPEELVSFVRVCASDYIYPYLTPKDLRLLSTNT